MRFLRLTLAFTLVFHLSSCANITTTLFGETDQRVDAWIERKEYGKALDVLARVPPGNPDYEHAQARLREVTALANRYENQVMADAARSEARGDWDAALATYRDALNHLPDSKRLQQGLKQIRRHRQGRIAQLERELLISKGRWLVESLPSQEALTGVKSGDRKARRSLETMHKEARAVARQLLREGRTALAIGDLNLAKRTLPLAARLDSSPEVTQANSELAKAEAQRTLRKRLEGERAKDEELRRKSEELIAAFREAWEAKDLVRAQQLMGELERLAGRDPEAVKLRNQLNRAVAAAIDRYLKEGVSAYSHNRFEQAIARWRRILELDPDNAQAHAHIERALRVLDNLQQLREKQGGN